MRIQCKGGEILERQTHFSQLLSEVSPAIVMCPDDTIVLAIAAISKCCFLPLLLRKNITCKFWDW